MRLSNLPKFVGAGVLAASLTVLPLTLPAHAQSNAPATSTQQDANTSGTSGAGLTTRNTERDHNNWGWFGLLGLTGLFGLLKNGTREVRHTSSSNDPGVGVR